MGCAVAGFRDRAEIQFDCSCEPGSTFRLTPKKPHPIPPRHAFHTRMKKHSVRVSSEGRVMDHAAASTEQMELHCKARPGSPSAVRRPQLFFRGDLWIAVLGPSVEEGIVGIGPTAAAALRAFDAQYLAGLRPVVETATKVGALRGSDDSSNRLSNSGV